MGCPPWPAPRVDDAVSGAGRELVLLSGGIDSACLLGERRVKGAKPEALFVAYGQPAEEEEEAASCALAADLGADWSKVEVGGIVLDVGEIAGRNALLAHLALTWLGRGEAALIYLGIHAGTPYRDCSPPFVSETQRSLDFQSGGAVRLVAPFVNWSKELIVARALELSLPLELTHSCERSGTPCSECPSCIDRSELLASA